MQPDDSRTPEQIRVPVTGGELAALYWGADAPAAPLVVLLHGLTADATDWAPVAAALAGDCEVVVPDLRGRAASAELPGPYGLSAHAADVTALLEHFGADGGSGADVTVLVGHSMGAFVAALATAGQARHLVHGLVLVDGGLPLAVPPAADLADALAAVFGTSPDDVTGTSPQGRRAVPEAVQVDGGDLLANEAVLEATTGFPVPTTLLWAPRGPQGAEPGLYDQVRLAGMGLPADEVTVREVPGTDHWSILRSADGVAAISGAVRDAAARD
ncbi:alpha/beta fold hydrolase [Modestobacter lapidis]|nr:alpha/beta hydrolase [Modestobacter lapidis]